MSCLSSACSAAAPRKSSKIPRALGSFQNFPTPLVEARAPLGRSPNPQRSGAPKPHPTPPEGSERCTAWIWHALLRRLCARHLKLPCQCERPPAKHRLIRRAAYKSIAKCRSTWVKDCWGKSKEVSMILRSSPPGKNTKRFKI